MKKLICVLCFVLGAKNALANTAQSTLNLFSPTNDQVDFTLVERSSVTEKKYFNSVLFFDLAYQSLALYGSPNIDPEDIMSFAHLGISYGLTDRLEIGGRFPVLFEQSFNDDQIGSSLELTGKGFTNAIGFLKYNFIKKKTMGLSVLAQVGVSNSESNFYLGEDSGTNFSLSFLYDKKIGNWMLGLNGGFLSRSPGDRGPTYAFFEPIDSTLFASFGLSRNISKRSGISLEFLFNQHDFEIDSSDREKEALEAFLSMRTQYKKVRFTYGLSTGLIDGVSVPAIRGFLGMNYKFTIRRKSKLDSEDSNEEVTPVDQGEDAESSESSDEQTDEDTEETEEDTFSEGTIDVEEAEEIVPTLIEQTITIEEEDEVSAKLEEFDEQTKGEKAAFQKIILNYVEFEFNSYTLNQKSKGTLDGVIKYLAGTKFESLEIIGHTDFYGTTVYNELLSLKRAKSVLEYFESEGVDKSKMKFNGYGKRRPISVGVSEEERQKNRRVEIIIRNR